MEPTTPRPNRSRRRRRIAGAALAISAGLAAVLAASSAEAADHKVTLCHATASTTNPYVAITVDVHSITKEGHGSHDGPVFTPGIAERWGDVIPAFDLGGTSYPGKNVGGAGDELLARGCQVTPTTSTTESTTSTTESTTTTTEPTTTTTEPTTTTTGAA